MQKQEHLFDPKPTTAALDNRGSYEERMNHILSAATGAIARLGYEKASMREVAKASGVSLAGLYHYFESKERILFLIQFRAFGSLLNNLREKISGVDDPETQLRIMIREHLAYFAANMGALKVCSHELDSLTGDAYADTRDIRHEYYGVTRGIIERLLDTRGHNGTAERYAIDRHVTTMALFGTLNWLYRWYDPQRGPAVSTVANQIADQFLYGVFGRTGANGNQK